MWGIKQRAFVMFLRPHIFAGPVYLSANNRVSVSSQHGISDYRIVPEEQEYSYQNSHQLPDAFLEALSTLYPQHNLLAKQGSGHARQQSSVYPPSNSYSSQLSSGGSGQAKHGVRSGYGHKKQEKKVVREKIYVPVPIKQKKRKNKKRKCILYWKTFVV